jgi:hypothetical protein
MPCVSADLDAIFDAGTLVRPSDERPNLVHLVRAVYTLGGAPDLDHAPAVRHLLDLIRTGRARELENVVFVLLDGLGMNLIRRLPPDAFLARHLRAELSATCPSTTACALTTIATANYPNRHGVSGWFTHLPEFGLTAVTLPFLERFSHQPLTERGIGVEDVFPLPAVHPRLTHDPLTLTPSYIANTTYNVYSRGATAGLGYTTLPDAVDKVVAHVTSGGGPTYTHLYVHDIDTLCHHKGTAHDDIIPLVQRIDAQLARLADAVRGRATIVVSADHGLIDVPAVDQTLLLSDDPLLALLACPPSGDARMPVFHVRGNRHEAFRDQFLARFGDRMILLPTAEAERMQLFGPGPMSPVARRRFGDFIGIPFKPATLAFHPPGKPLGNVYLAVHAGLSPQEMWVPLCIA